MSEVKIITLDPERWAEAKALRLQALERVPEAFGATYQEDAALSDDVWRRRLEAAQNGTGPLALYAELDGQLVGMMGGMRSHREKLAHTAVVWGVYVAEEARGRGVGSMLMAHLLDAFKEMGVEKTSLTVNPMMTSAVALYEKFGFEKRMVMEKEMKAGGVYYDEVWMVKFFD